MIDFDRKTEAPDLVASVFKDVHDRGGTDMYWLPHKEGVNVRCRINGVQESLGDIPKSLGGQCLTHIKVLAGLLTYRTSIAQDGVIRWKDGAVELRVASMPTIFGERITIRMMSNQATPQRLTDLGFKRDVVARLKKMIQRPHGLIVLTGPTGCGKTTTIYALLRELLDQNQDPASIITLEDPVECVLDGISQVAVNSDGEEWNYEIALKSALRQDVKTLVIGEIRDANVARVVLDAALTGHRIITTYHAGDVASVYARLLHQGYEPFLIASAITGVVSQRLIPHDNARIPACAVLDPDDEWREFICSNPGLGQLRRAIQAQHPLASIEDQIAALLKEGRISKEQFALLTAGEREDTNVQQT